MGGQGLSLFGWQWQTLGYQTRQTITTWLDQARTIQQPYFPSDRLKCSCVVSENIDWDSPPYCECETWNSNSPQQQNSENWSENLRDSLSPQTCWWCGWSAAGPREYFRPKFLSPGVTLCWSHSGSGQLGARFVAWEKMISLIPTQRLTRAVRLAWCLGLVWTTREPREPEPTSSSPAESPALSCQEELSPRQIGF